MRRGYVVYMATTKIGVIGLLTIAFGSYACGDDGSEAGPSKAEVRAAIEASCVNQLKCDKKNYFDVDHCILRRTESYNYEKKKKKTAECYETMVRTYDCISRLTCPEFGTGCEQEHDEEWDICEGWH